MNYSYENIEKIGKIIYPFKQIELTEQDIIRGYNVYDFFINQILKAFAENSISDLTKTEQKAIELLEVEKPTLLTSFRTLCAENNITKDCYFRLIRKVRDNKTKQATIKKIIATNRDEITRLF